MCVFTNHLQFGVVVYPFLFNSTQTYSDMAVINPSDPLTLSIYKGFAAFRTAWPAHPYHTKGRLGQRYR